MFVYTQENDLVATCSKQSSIPEGAIWKEVLEVPTRLHRSAWRIVGDSVLTNLPLARLIAHEKRRAKRELLFKPHDEIIAKQIPGQNAQAAESARATIRFDDAILQDSIDNIISEVELLDLYELEEL